VIIPVVTQHFTMLARNLLYTGVTRGKRLVVLVGQKKAVGIAVRGGQMKSRWTKLREWLSAVLNTQAWTSTSQPQAPEVIHAPENARLDHA
jgi:ATP-dependent exoDNAse (exonuclease V) alpha subunit